MSSGAQLQSVAVPIPASLLGWNARDPIQNMESGYAIRLINWFPRFGDIAVRNGFQGWGHYTSASAVESLYEFAGRDGARKLIGATGANIVDYTTQNSPALLGTGFTNARWQSQNFSSTAASYLVMVNGADKPQLYDGAAIADAAFTTSSVAQTTFFNVSQYRNRLYFLSNNSTKVFYGDVNAIGGACLDFDFGSLFWYGGYPIFAGSVTQNFGSRSDDYFVVATQMGEIITFTGSAPDKTDWFFAGRYKIPPLIGKRSYALVGSDIVFNTIQGVIPLSSVQQASGDEGKYLRITDAIQYAFALAAKSYKNNFGWQIIDYPQGLYRLINIPVGSEQYVQYVINARTGAWCQFNGMNAACWSLCNDNLFFGGASGNVYQADYGTSDNGAPIFTRFKCAFNYLGDNQDLKSCKFLKPFATSQSKITVPLTVDVDFQDKNVIPTTIVGGSGTSNWDTSPWDSTPWDNDVFYTNTTAAVTGLGKAIAARGDFYTQNVELAIASFELIYETGGLI